MQHVASGKVEITSQNHNFCVDPDSLEGIVDITHINLNDHTNEGMSVRNQAAFSVQYHPEAGPGPHDASYLFGMFEDMMDDPISWRDRPMVRRATPVRTPGLPQAELGVA